MRRPLRRSGVITGSQLKGMLAAGSEWLTIHVDVINALNVFPVPDGDTGTNMMLTMRAAMAAIADHPEAHAGHIAVQAARGALQGARGNSGAILSQILGGLAQSVAPEVTISIPALVTALQAATDSAYQAVLKPVEGTILTVIKALACHGQRLAHTTSNLELFLAQTLLEAQQALQATPTLLPMLQRAGVVDAGGLGLVYIWEGMSRYVRGLPLEARPDEGLRDIKPLRLNEVWSSLWSHPYDVQFIIEGDDLDVAAIRCQINRMGTSSLVVGDASLVKVHIHVSDPNAPLQYGLTQGALRDVVVENMVAQSHRFLEQEAALEAQADSAIICVAPGPGLAEIFASLGAGLVLNSGQTANLNARDFLAAIDQVEAGHIFILPNQADLMPAAQEAGRLAEKRVTLLPTRTVPAGINAALAFNAAAGPATNLKRMQQATQIVHTLEITRASQTSAANNIQAIYEGEPLSHGYDTLPVSLEALAAIETAAFELLTIYYGADISSEAAHALTKAIRTAYPHLEIEVLAGGQAHPLYIISLE